MSVGKNWTKGELNFLIKRIKQGKKNEEIFDDMFAHYGSHLDPKPMKKLYGYRGDFAVAHKITQLKKVHSIGTLGNRSKKFMTVGMMADAIQKKRNKKLLVIPGSEEVRRGRGRPPKTFCNIDPLIKDLLNHIVRTFEKKGIRTQA
jgi:hypothetical protein